MQLQAPVGGSDQLDVPSLLFWRVFGPSILLITGIAYHKGLGVFWFFA